MPSDQRRRILLIAAASAAGLTGRTPAWAQGGDVIEEVVRIPLVDGDVEYRLETTVVRPPIIDGSRPAIVLNHGVPADKSPASVRRRARPITQARFFVSIGFVVAIPMRRGYGQSEGNVSPFSCDIYGTAQEEAKDIIAAVRYMQSLSYAAEDSIILMGASAGALASFAAAAKVGPAVASVLNFSGGRRLRGALAKDCYPHALYSAFSRLGSEVAVPSLWLYSPGDGVFPTALVAECLRSFRASGGNAELSEIPVYSGDSHELFSNIHAMPIWAARVLEFLGDRTIKMQKVR